MECAEGIAESKEPDIACRLVKAIYGLQQSPCTWYEKIHQFFMQYQFIRSTQDYSLYIHYGQKVIVLVYVDDLVLRAAGMEDVSWINDALAEACEMTDLGKLQTFLGLDIVRDRSQLLLTIDQPSYINRILKRHGMHNSHPSDTSLVPNTQLQKSSTSTTYEPDNEKVSLEIYQSAVGSLMYAMLGMPPNMANSVGLVSQFNQAPEWEHWMVVKCIFRYHEATSNDHSQYGINNHIGGYSDADWESGQARKSIGGYVFLVNGGVISSTSKKQSLIPVLNKEAQYMATRQPMKEMIWLRILLDGIGAFWHIDPMSQLNADNYGAIVLARNPEYHTHTKHIDIQYHYIWNQVRAKKIHLEYCPSSDMVADILTMALELVAHHHHRQAMSIIKCNKYGIVHEGAC